MILLLICHNSLRKPLFVVIFRVLATVLMYSNDTRACGMIKRWQGLEGMAFQAFSGISASRMKAQCGDSGPNSRSVVIINIDGNGHMTRFRPQCRSACLPKETFESGTQ